MSVKLSCVSRQKGSCWPAGVFPERADPRLTKVAIGPGCKGLPLNFRKHLYLHFGKYIYEMHVYRQCLGLYLRPAGERQYP